MPSVSVISVVKRLRWIGLLPTLLLAISAQAAPEYVPGEILVKYQPLAALRRGAAVPLTKSAETRQILSSLGITRVRLAPGADFNAALAALRADPSVVYAEPNYIRHPIYTPNDPYFSDGTQYGPQIIQAPAAWNVTTGASRVIIAVIDSGIDGGHPEFAGHLLAGIDDAVYGANQTHTGAQHDGLGHGTHVSGIAAASINNSIGIAGIAGGCTILPVKVFPDSNNANDTELAQAIMDAANNNANVINMSLGGDGDSQVIQDAIDYAWSRGLVIVAAAGNSGGQYPNAAGNPFYPAGANHVIAVGATNSGDGMAGFSSYGAYVGIAAPGDNIASTYPTSSYAYLSGTSMASPHIAGVAALAFSSATGVTNAQVLAAMEGSADKVGGYVFDATGKNDHAGYGRVNAAATLTTLAALRAAGTVVNSQIQVKRGGFRFNRGDNTFVQQVTLTNRSGAAIAGPVSLVLNGLNATLVNATSLSGVGSPYIFVVPGSLNNGVSATVTLIFKTSGTDPIAYTSAVTVRATP